MCVFDVSVWQTDVFVSLSVVFCPLFHAVVWTGIARLEMGINGTVRTHPLYADTKPL